MSMTNRPTELPEVLHFATAARSKKAVKLLSLHKKCQEPGEPDGQWQHQLQWNRATADDT